MKKRNKNKIKNNNSTKKSKKGKNKSTSQKLKRGKVSLIIGCIGVIFSLILLSSIFIDLFNQPIGLEAYADKVVNFFLDKLTFVKNHALLLLFTAISTFIISIMILVYRRDKQYSYIKIGIFSMCVFSFYLITLKAINLPFPTFVVNSFLTNDLTSAQISFRLLLSVILEIVLLIIFNPICDYLNEKRFIRKTRKPEKNNTKIVEEKVQKEKKIEPPNIDIVTKKSSLGMNIPQPVDVKIPSFVQHVSLDTNDIGDIETPKNIEKYEADVQKINKEIDSEVNDYINQPSTISYETLLRAKKNVEEKMNKINSPKPIKKTVVKNNNNSNPLDLQSVIKDRVSKDTIKREDDDLPSVDTSIKKESPAVTAYKQREAKKARESVSRLYNSNSNSDVQKTDNYKENDTVENNNSIKNIMKSGHLIKATEEHSLKKEIDNIVSENENKKHESLSLIDEINKKAQEHRHEIIKDIDDISFEDEGARNVLSSSLYSNNSIKNEDNSLKPNEIATNNYYSSAKPVNGANLVDEKEETVKVIEEDEEDLESAIAGLSCSNFVNPNKFSYKFPPMSLLEVYPQSEQRIDDITKEKAEILIETLAQFKYVVTLRNIVKGPSITMFEVVPGKGIKVSAINNLRDNIAMNLKAKKVRILAPIPGQRAVGVEIPNDVREKVGFREVLQTIDTDRYSIPMAMGRNLYGDCKGFDVTTSPHMLIAGSTGSGKSVCVNSLICSILYSKTPREVRLIMVDPKVVELTIYNGIPHLLTPVITDPKRALKALDFCIDEMDRRNKMLAQMSVRNIKSYNKKIVEQRIAREKMPYIVVIIDEFASLMSIAGKELDEKVSRLTAMSRAVGIHLVFATQRPSVDVITGVIKNNLPTRVAFAVTSTQDSRTIIGNSGAEDLLGKGDMLFSENGKAVVRMQGVFLSDQEVEKIVDFAKQQEEPEYIDESYFDSDYEDEDSTPQSYSNEDGDLWDAALQIAYERNGTSASFLQRRLRIGYNKAARLIEAMEEEGILGPPNGSKPRELLKYQ
ncbi:MAG: DNA translocase FtsK [Pleomorphochaeta sp.]